VAESVGSALGFWKRQVDAAAPGGPPVTYELLVDDYLGETHRNHPGAGYPVGALAGDIGAATIELALPSAWLARYRTSAFRAKS